jgi:hypothetical protein
LQTTKVSSKLGPLAAFLDAHPQQTSSTNHTEEKENNPTYKTKQNNPQEEETH